MPSHVTCSDLHFVLHLPSIICVGSRVHSCCTCAAFIKLYSHESPEVADQFVIEGQYQGHPCLDVWAMGHCIMLMMRGRRPTYHARIVQNLEYQQEIKSPFEDLSKMPACLDNLQYLQSLIKNDLPYEVRPRYSLWLECLKVIRLAEVASPMYHCASNANSVSMSAHVVQLLKSLVAFRCISRQRQKARTQHKTC